MEKERKEKESNWETQRKKHYEDPDQYNKLNLGARPKIDMSQEEDYIEKDKEEYKRHEQMEPYTERQTYKEGTQRQFKNYGQQESTPNKTNFPNMENSCNEEELDINLTRIEKPTETEME